MRQAPPEPADRLGGEEGASLVIALIFLIVGTLVVISLTNLTGVNLTSTFSLQGERAVEYAADGGVDGAIQALRYNQPAPVQASGVYQASGCPQYNPSTSLNEDGASYYTYVSCNFMTFATGSSVANSNVITPSNGSGWCVPGEVGQSVSDNNPVDQGNIPPGDIVSGCSASGAWIISSAATLTRTSAVTIGTPGERIVLFSGCSAAFQLASCAASQPSSQAFVTAVIDFANTDANGVTNLGYRAFVESWTVTRANG